MVALLQIIPVLVGASHAKEFFKTDDIKFLSIGAGLNKQKISGETAALWGGVGWLRNDLMAMMLDSEIHHHTCTRYPW